MFLRFTYLYVTPQNAEEVARIYLNEIAPEIRKQKGSKEVLLLQSTDHHDELITSTLWESEEDIKNFEAGSDHPNVMGRVKEIVSKPPTQKYFRVSS